MKYFVTEKEIESLVKTKLTELNCRYDLVMGVARGGLVPAVYASYALYAPLTVIGIKSYDKHKQTYRGEITQHPVLVDPNHQYLQAATHDPAAFSWVTPKPKRVLIVDDVNDTGYTFRFIQGYLSNPMLKHNHYDFLSVFGKNKTTFQSIVCKTVPDDEWIVFPWDV